MIKKFIPFWAFLTLFKFGGGLHYTLLAPLGEKVLPIWMVGLVIGILALIQVFLDIPAGYLLDRFGYKKLLKFTTLIFLSAGLCLFLGLTIPTFILTAFASSFGWLFFGPGVNAYVVNQANKTNVGKMSSARDVFSSIGIVLTSAAVIFAVYWEVEIIGGVLAALFLLAYFAISFSPDDKENGEPTHESHHRRIRSKKNFLREAWKKMVELRPVSFLMVAAGFSSSIFYALIWFVVPLLLVKESSGVLGLGLGVFDLAIVVLGFFLGRLVDSFDKKMLVLLGLLIFSVFGILIGFNLGILFLFLGFFATVGDELSGLALWAWLYNIDKKHESYGLISGTIGFFEDAGWTIGPIAAGILYGIIGPSWTIATGGMLVLANVIIFLLLVKHPLPQTFLPFPKKHHRARHKE